MNTTDEALMLIRRLRGFTPTPRIGRIKYRAYKRWMRRNAKEAGAIAPSSIVAQRALVARESGR